MPKLAIYVPKKDMKEIDRWRKKINFSRIFMNALAREIRERSRSVEASKDKLAAAAEHYRQQLIENAAPLTDFGYRLGSDQVLNCRIEASAIGQLAAIKDPQALSSDEIQVLEQCLGDAPEKQMEQFCSEKGFDEQSYPVVRRAIYHGFIKGVLDAWREVCQQIKGTSRSKVTERPFAQ
jgi:hypothetical protein